MQRTELAVAVPGVVVQGDGLQGLQARHNSLKQNNLFNVQPFIHIFFQLWSGIKVNSGMGLPMLHKMYIRRQKVSSHPFPLPSLYSPLSYWLFPFLIIVNKLSALVIVGGKLDFGVDFEIRWGCSQFPHRVPYPMFSLNLASGSTSEVSYLDLRHDLQSIRTGSTGDIPNLFQCHDLQPIGTRFNRRYTYPSYSYAMIFN